MKVFEKFTCFGLSNWFTELWSNCLMVMVLVMIIALKSLKKKKRKNITKIGTDYDPNAIVKRSLSVFSGYYLVHILEETNIFTNLFILKKSENFLFQNIVQHMAPAHAKGPY